MRTIKILTVLVVSTVVVCGWSSGTVFAQVQGNSVTRGARVGASSASRGTSLMSRFNQYSVGADQFTVPVSRTTRDPLSARTTVSMRGPMPGVADIRNRRPTAQQMDTGLIRPARPMNSSVLKPARPSALDTILSSGSKRISTMATRPQNRMFAMEREKNPFRPIGRNTPRPFTAKPRSLQPLQLQQHPSQTGLLGGSLTMAQRLSMVYRNTLTYNKRAGQQTQLFQKPTLFDMGRQHRDRKRTSGSIFNVR